MFYLAHFSVKDVYYRIKLLMIWLAPFFIVCLDSIITPISCTYFLFRNVGTESPCPTITPSSSPAMTLDFRLVKTWLKTIFEVTFEFRFHRIFLLEEFKTIRSYWIPRGNKNSNSTLKKTLTHCAVKFHISLVLPAIVYEMTLTEY